MMKNDNVSKSKLKYKAISKRYKTKDGRLFEIIKAKEWKKDEGCVDSRVVLVAWYDSNNGLSEFSTNIQTANSKKYDEKGNLSIVDYNEELEPCFAFGHYEFWLNYDKAEEDFNIRTIK